MVNLAFCDYHNMAAILEKIEHNTDFHQIVDFLEASHIRYALTISPTIYVSHIRQFWSTGRIKTMDQETKIIATVDGKPRTISESSLRRHLKLNDDEGISSLPDAELFENLSLMDYNILPSQRKVFTILRVNSPGFSGRTVPLFASMIVTQGEGLANLTKPHHTPSPQEHHSPQHDSPPLLHQTIIPEPIPRNLQAPTETLTPRRLTKRAIRIAQSKALSPDAYEPASLSRDDRHGEAFLLSDIEISGLKARVKSLEDKGRRREEPITEDAPITRGIIDIGEELRADKSTEKGSNDTEEMVNVLSSMEATNILSSGGAAFSTTSVFPADVFPTAGVPTVSGSFPTPMRIPIISAKDKGKEKVTETKVPKKKKLQEQIDAQVAKEMEEGFARENQRLSEQVARDSEIARIYAEEEVKLMIEGLDRSNEVIAKHLSEYEQAEADLSVGEKIELMSELVKNQDHLAAILKYQVQQCKPLSKKEQRGFYMSVLRSHAGWKTKHFRGMTLEKIKEKFIPVWKQWEDFVPMSSKEESERVKRSRIKLDQGSLKRMKISHTSRSKPSQEQQFKGSKGVSEEELKGMMQLVPLEEVYSEAL
nr:hypothetical protein [Tanacetum cinerariifolium]